MFMSIMTHVSIRHIRPAYARKIVLNSVARMATSATHIQKTSVAKNMLLQKVIPTTEQEKRQKAPLVLFFPWLRASEKAVDKYCDLYHSKGMDVLVIRSDLMDFLWPNKAVRASVELLDYLLQSDVCQEKNPLLVHAFSVGAYAYSVLMLQMNQNSTKYRPISGLIRGQLFDSIVIGSLDHMTTGIIKSTKPNKLVELCIRGTMSTYFKLTQSTTVRFYDEAIETFKNNRMPGPKLLYYSLDDPMASPASMNELITAWSADASHDVMYKCWESSPHAGHLRMHPMDYVSMHDVYLRKSVPDVINGPSLPKSARL